MAKITITIDDANPAIVAALGDGTVDTVSVLKGYQEMVANPDYVPEIGSIQIPDSSWTPGVDESEADRPLIDNPDYVPAVGTPTIPNTKTKGAFLAEKVLADVIVPWLFKEKEAAARKEVETQLQQVKQIVTNAAEIRVE